MNLVILDANFLLVPSQFGVDIYDEIRMQLTGSFQFVYVPEVIDELKNKQNRSSSKKFKRSVDLALKLLEFNMSAKSQNFLINPPNKPQSIPVDEYLIKLAQNFLEQNIETVYIATNDKELKKSALTHGIRVIYLRQKKFIELSV
ncbi:MAG: nucleotide-binding protein [Candidatus Lokiarchaeota archaeon]|nr:nucleotide-binding protein [Candidatus Lokiarchaeota archaeon]